VHQVHVSSDMLCAVNVGLYQWTNACICNHDV